MASAYQKLIRFYFRYEPAIVVSAIVVAAHIGWKKLQEIPGIGDEGKQGYPHERVSFSTITRVSKSQK